MTAPNYLEWLSRESPTIWWHDSGAPKELAQALAWGARGATTNPVLAIAAIRDNQDLWRDEPAGSGIPASAGARAERLMERVVKNAASLFEPLYRESGRSHGHGYVCAQVNPSLCADRDAMLEMADRFVSWAPNVSVKLPATSAGLGALEELAAKGICVTSTLSFTVAQAVAAAEAYKRGKSRALKAGIAPAPCFAVIMLGRVDDYIREVVSDNRLDIGETEIKNAGLAIVKRAYGEFRKKGFEATLMVAALRGVHHMIGLFGAEIVMSIHPSIQKLLLAPGVSRSMGIAEPVPADSIERLNTIAEFRKAFELDGLEEREFITYGLTQKTLSQFSAGGWALLESFQPRPS